MEISDIIRLFPAVVAPVLVDRLRRRYPSLDGLLVWPVVLVVAVCLAFVATFLRGVEPSVAMALAAAREGLAMGAAAIGLHYLAKGKEAPAKPAAGGKYEVTIPPAAAWGPPPSKPS